MFKTILNVCVTLGVFEPRMFDNQGFIWRSQNFNDFILDPCFNLTFGQWTILSYMVDKFLQTNKLCHKFTFFGQKKK